MIKYIIILYVFLFFMLQICNGAKCSEVIISISFNQVEDKNLIIRIDKHENDSLEVKYFFRKDKNIFDVDTIFLIENNSQLDSLKDFEDLLSKGEINPTDCINKELFHNYTYITFAYRNHGRKKIKLKEYNIKGGYYNINDFLKKLGFPLFQEADINCLHPR